MKWIIDLGEEENEHPLARRKSISLLLGASFSAPMGYPIGNEMNDRLLNFDDNTLDFSPEGYLVSSTDGTKPMFQMNGIYNSHHLGFHSNLILVQNTTAGFCILTPWKRE